MRRGDRRTITVEKKVMDAEYLGKGRHATAYRVGDVVYLFTVEDEYMKDVLYENFDPPFPAHIPEVTRYDEQSIRGQWRKVYSMPFYPNITAADDKAWPVLKVLKAEADRIFREKYIREDKRLGVHGAYFARDVIEETTGKVPKSVTAALDAMANAMANYGCGVTFEFGARNIGVDKKGRIVFRDIMFDAEKVERENAVRMKKHRGY